MCVGGWVVSVPAAVCSYCLGTMGFVWLLPANEVPGFCCGVLKWSSGGYG